MRCLRGTWLFVGAFFLVYGSGASLAQEKPFFACNWGKGHCGPSMIVGTYHEATSYKTLSITFDTISIGHRAEFSYRVESIEPWTFILLVRRVEREQRV